MKYGIINATIGHISSKSMCGIALSKILNEYTKSTEIEDYVTR